jgi:hypothetical protein
MNYLTMFIRLFSFFLMHDIFSLIHIFIYTLYIIKISSQLSLEPSISITMYIKLSLIKEKHDSYLISISLHILKVWA